MEDSYISQIVRDELGDDLAPKAREAAERMTRMIFQKAESEYRLKGRIAYGFYDDNTSFSGGSSQDIEEAIKYGDRVRLRLAFIANGEGKINWENILAMVEWRNSDRGELLRSLLHWIQSPYVLGLILKRAIMMTDEERQWIWENIKNKEILLGDAFRRACFISLETAKWVYSLGHVGYTDEPYLCAVVRGDLAMAQWLYSLGGIDSDPPHNSERGWRVGYMDCREGITLPMAQWLYSLGVSEKTYRNYWEKACKDGSSKTLEWLMGTPEMTEELALESLKLVARYAEDGETRTNKIRLLIRSGVNPSDLPGYLLESIKEELEQITISLKTKSARSSEVD